jgi:hypothetical protein
MSHAPGPGDGPSGRARALTLAGLGYALALLVAVFSDDVLREPLLESLGIGFLILAGLLSAALAASWWFLAAGIPALVLVGLASDAASAWAVFSAIVSAPLVFGGLAAAVAIGKGAERTWAGAARILARAVSACILLALAVVGLDAIRGPVDKHPADPIVVDWRRGTVEGVRLGDSEAKAISVLGQPERRGHREPGVPIDEEEVDGPVNYGSPKIARRIADYSNLRYRRRVLGTIGGRVDEWGSIDPRAQTPEGVGVGDDPELVERRYNGVNCYTVNEGTEYEQYPLCKVRPCKGRLLAFGGDPIKSVWLIATAKIGLKKGCRPWGKPVARQ